MKRFALACGWFLLGCSRVEPPPPPPPPPPPASTAPAPSTPAVVAPAPTSVALAPPPSAPMLVPTTTAVAPPPPTAPPMPTPSAICQRAARCCTTAAAQAPRGIPRHGHSPRELLMAHDRQCAQAIGVCAEALMQMGERPPEYCTQPGRR